MSDADFNHAETNPGLRRDLIDSILKSKGKYVAPGKPIDLPPEVKLMIDAKVIFDHITNTVAVPMLRVLPDVASYQPAATQILLKDQFLFHFNKWSKDELVQLLAMMHAEELEKVVKGEVQGGNLGMNFGKPN